ncbi:hypothetical protein FRX31_028550 [Thalictrum thalictroides]|uniref:Reverse transcriptase zinc-binding domain-containing protein n=1 Tax=Thalictrum thalictroides TaxID=46969 RepID=A0A7J6VCA5_THATH|nr:hypothetical protein FRX31_028550 [Thalictrum thalictroides]
MWSLAWGRILTVDNLHARGRMIPNRCALSRGDAESIHHLFVSSPTSQLNWDELLGHIPNFSVLINQTSTTNFSGPELDTVSCRGFGWLNLAGFALDSHLGSVEY